MIMHVGWMGVVVRNKGNHKNYDILYTEVVNRPSSSPMHIPIPSQLKLCAGSGISESH